MQACPVCIHGQIDTPWETAVGMCTDCANVYGVMPMMPARRPALPCQRCNSMQFIRAVPRELTVEVEYEINRQVASPMPVTFEYQWKKSWLGGRTALPIDSRKAFGYLEQYICRKCGFVEWYCNDPERIPVGPAYMTEAIDYGASDTPYRG